MSSSKARESSQTWHPGMILHELKNSSSFPLYLKITVSGRGKFRVDGGKEKEKMDGAICIHVNAELCVIVFDVSVYDVSVYDGDLKSFCLDICHVFCTDFG
ncbi:hypothetical protein IMY05_002G0030300 [Salix suchowensis]|nr:hypothetical protein IMY05_002G0030300 [Salix suchowensis]